MLQLKITQAVNTINQSKVNFQENR